MLFSHLFQCVACQGPTPRGFVALCEPCQSSLIECPTLCPGCGTTFCIQVSKDNPSICRRPWASQSRSQSVIRSYYARYWMAGQAYPVLKKWKLHRGLLFDRQVLNSTPKMLQHISSLNVQTVVPIPQYFHRTWQMKGSAADRIAEWIGQEVSLPVAHILRFNPHASLLKRQAQKTLSERLENPTQRFIKNRKVQKIPGKILLVDDFKTTGRTLSYASQVLGHLGVSEIHIFCLGMVATKHDLG